MKQLVAVIGAVVLGAAQVAPETVLRSLMTYVAVEHLEHTPEAQVPQPITLTGEVVVDGVRQRAQVTVVEPAL